MTDNSIGEATADREKTWERERLERGFDHRELWSLDVTIAKFILPRLISFREISDQSIPAGITLEKWNEILDGMIDGFSLMSSDVYFHSEPTHDRRIKEALSLFSKWLGDLWT